MRSAQQGLDSGHHLGDNVFGGGIRTEPTCVVAKLWVVERSEPGRPERAVTMGRKAMVGTPARSPAAVVPAPQWYATAATRGNSHWCGVSPMVIMLPNPMNTGAASSHRRQ